MASIFRQQPNRFKAKDFVKKCNSCVSYLIANEFWEYTPPAPSGDITMQVNIGGVFKEVSARYANIGGVWKEISSISCNIGGTWKSEA